MTKSSKQIVAEARQQRMAFFAQKRELLFVNALTAIIRRAETKADSIADNVKLAVNYADEAFKALYIAPANEGEQAGE